MKKANQAKTRRDVAILVLGMHRSGTSAVARTLNLLGVSLGTRMIQGEEDNNRLGFWEHADAVDINERLLSDLGRSWHDVRLLPAGWEESEAASEALRRIRGFVRDEFAHCRRWLIKDPRLCLLAPLWMRALDEAGIAVRPLLVLRHPEEVALSLMRRDGLVRSHALALWAGYIASACAALGDQTCAVLDYARFLEDWRASLLRQSRFLGIDRGIGRPRTGADIEAFLHQDERHHVVSQTWRAVGYDPLAQAVADGYQSLVGMHGTSGRIMPAVRTHLQQTEGLRASLDVPLTEYFAHVQSYVRRVSQLETRLVDSVISTDGLVSALTHEQSRHSDSMAEVVRLNQQLLVEREAAGQQQGSLVEALRGEQARVEEESAEKDRALAMLKACEIELTQVQAEARRLASAYQALLASRSWRLTAPLRWMRRHLVVAQLKSLIGRASKRAYDRLPVRMGLKLALKRHVFRSFAPVLKTTASYRAWEAFERLSATPVQASPEVKGLASENPQTIDRVPEAPGQAHQAAVLLQLQEEAAGHGRADYIAMAHDPVRAEDIDVRAIAFYLPQFHPIPENDAWWGRGFTEWTNVSKAVPQFVGHYQPRLPGELGFYDLRVVDVMRHQVELARHYGLHGFCFHYYWFGGRRLLERPLQQLLDAKDIDFPFCICWANENWTRRWDGLDQEVLVAQQYSPEDDLAFIQALEPILRDTRYIRVDGRPLIVLYRPSILPDARDTLERWRTHCRRAGIGELFLAMVQFDVEDPRTYGFDAAIEFPPHKLARGLPPINDQLEIVNPDYRGYVVDYTAVIERARQQESPGYDMIRGVFPSWDNEARKPGAGYTFAGATPQRYREWLDIAVDYAHCHPVAGERLVFINAWNEWAEGAYLEPDRRYGYAFLEQTRQALTLRPDARSNRIVLVSHDAHPHGAQYLALNMARQFNELFQIHVDVVLLGEGRLRDEFARWATVHDLSGRNPEGAEAMALAARLQATGARQAICNTTVSGLFAGVLKRAGFRVVGLIHELPGVIRSNYLEAHALAMARSTDRLVFPAQQVLDGFHLFATPGAGQVVIRPQGLYKSNRYASPEGRRKAAALLRQRLGISAASRVVLCVGYADHRKGVDFFVEIGTQLMHDVPDVHFVWVGHFDSRIEPAIRDAVCATRLDSRFHFPGMESDTDVYYAGADVYALTSREDPFPSVVLEALQAGIPVIGFDGAGGFTDPLCEFRCGVVVPAFNMSAFVNALRNLLDHPVQAQNLGKRGCDLVAERYSFRTYLFDLLGMLGISLPTVSVIVPNFNYAHHLVARLDSITNQSVPFYELIVLDDASTDDSVRVIRQYACERGMPLRVIVNKQNSGSVFRQWSKGVSLATGKYVWIAEADDLCGEALLERLLGAMDDPQVVMAYAQSRQIDGDGRPLAGHYRDYTDDVSRTRWLQDYRASGLDEIRNCLTIKNTIPNVSAALFLRSALVAALERDLELMCNFKIAGDWVAYLGVLELGDVAFVAEPLNIHRRHGASVTIGGDPRPHVREVIDVQCLAQQRYKPSQAMVAQSGDYLRRLCAYFELDASEFAAPADVGRVPADG